MVGLWALGTLGLAAPTLAGTTDPLDAYRVCAGQLGNHSGISREFDAVVVGGQRANKSGVYSLVAGGLLYWHECKDSPARLEYPPRVGTQQPQFAYLDSRRMVVQNSQLPVPKGAKPRDVSGSWTLSHPATPPATGCVGQKAVNPTLTARFRDMAADAAKAACPIQNKQAFDAMTRDAETNLKGKIRRKVGDASSASTQIATKIPWTEIEPETRKLIEDRKTRLERCKLSLSGTSDRQLLLDVENRISALESVKKTLDQMQTSSQKNGVGTGR